MTDASLRRQRSFADPRPANLVGGCAYCGVVGYLSRDHRLPRSLGGTSAPENIVLACRRCNTKKGNLRPDEWYAWLDSEIGRAWVALGQDGPIGRSLGHPMSGGASVKSRRRPHQDGYCDECGGRLPKHFTRCADIEARRLAAWNGA